MFKKFPYLPAALTLALGAGSAQAVPVTDLFFPGELNLLQDDSGESLGFDGASDGLLDVGDTIRGTFGITSISGGGGTNLLGTGVNNELTGIYEILVDSKIFASGELFNYTFVPYLDFGFTYGTNAMMAFFDDSAQDYNRSGSIAQAEASATNGNLAMTTGFSGDLDESWTAVLPENLLTLTSGTFNFNLSILFEDFATVDFAQVNTHPGAGGGGLIDLTGAGSMFGSRSGDYDTWNDLDMVVAPITVSEPVTILLMGLGLAGIGYRRR